MQMNICGVGGGISCLIISRGKCTGQESVYTICMYGSCRSCVLTKDNWFAFLCSVGGTLAVSFYFITLGRFPPWVQDSVFLVGSFAPFIVWENVETMKEL